MIREKECDRMEITIQLTKEQIKELLKINSSLEEAFKTVIRKQLNK